jgi:hypothetical protein
MGFEKLDQHSAKATFFALENIEAYPSIFKINRKETFSR